MQIDRITGRRTNGLRIAVAVVVLVAVLDLDDGGVERAPRQGGAGSGRGVLPVRRQRLASADDDEDDDDDNNDQQSGKNETDHETETSAVTRRS